MFKRDWTTCSKHVNHFRHKSQLNWENPLSSFDKNMIPHFGIKLDISMSSKHYEGPQYMHDLDLLIILH
jgi:hypothetical protein